MNGVHLRSRAKNSRSPPNLKNLVISRCCFSEDGRDGRDSALVEQASHQCGPGSIPGLGAKCGLSLLLVLVLAPRGFSPGTPVFPLLKNQHFQIPIRSGIRGPQVCQSDCTVKCHPR